MRISATADVSEAQLQTLARELAWVSSVEVDASRTFYKSVEPPSWIVLFEHVPTWVAALGPAVALFTSELLKEAAKDAYRNKAAVGRALAMPIVAPLRGVASALARFRRAGGRTQIDIGVPTPDDHFGTRLRLEGQDEDSLALEIALFVKHSGALAVALEKARGGGPGVVGQVVLKLHPDGAMSAQWMDADLKRRSVKIAPPAP
jgi:hypothetical protein